MHGAQDQRALGVGPRYDRQRKPDGQRLQQIENDMWRMPEIDEETLRFFGLQRAEKLILIADHSRYTRLSAGHDLFLDLCSELGLL